MYLNVFIFSEKHFLCLVFWPSFRAVATRVLGPNIIVLAILVKESRGNIPVKFEWNWLIGLGGVVI